MKEDGVKTLRIHVSGTVQGVGFRPFLHKLAGECGVFGRVWNDENGVELLLTGKKEQLEAALHAICSRPPSLAHVESVRAEETALTPFTDFQILPSQKHSAVNAGVAADVCICEDCRRELLDPSDRRYRYPFINCTNCGPRFTIIKSVPYDRSNTSMSAFPMCKECAGEYADIENRRYHAQPDCCDDCGPQVFFLDRDKKPVSGDAIEIARAYLKGGRIVAVKGLGGIHLACDPFSASAVKRLREGKRRDERPFALMCADLAAAKALCHVSEAEAALLQSRRRPIVLLKKKDESLESCSENGYLGVMLPYTPLHCLLMGKDIKALVMTSANLSQRPILYKNDEALLTLDGIADGFLLHDRDIVIPCDDSLLYCVDEKAYPLRRSRGFVPEKLKLPFHGGCELLACGAEQKAGFAYAKDGYACLSQHIGDMKNMETLELYENLCAHFSRLFEYSPKGFVCDLHPDYLSSAYAKKRAEQEKLPILAVQHHHAHMASCMADNELLGECIGVIWDGTGYGSDKTIWGGEFFSGGYERAERRGSIRPIALAGGDKAIVEIGRVALALALDAGENLPASYELANADAIAALLRQRINAPLSSGMGRLFDGVYALLTGRMQVSYEGQGAMLLEAMAREEENGVYPVAFYEDKGLWVCDYRPMLRALLFEKRSGEENGRMAARFMNTLCAFALNECQRIRRESALTRVVLSGGVFLNQYLLQRLTKTLAEDGFDVYHHSRVSTNDEGIAFGQLCVALAREMKRKEKHVSCDPA